MVSKEKANLITSYIEKSNRRPSQKRSSSVLSPVEKKHQNKKVNMENNENNQQIEGPNIGKLKSLLGPLIEKVDQLRDAVDSKYTKLETAITIQKQEVSEELHKIEESISSQKLEIKDLLAARIEENSKKVQRVLEENVTLRKENVSLKERLDRIESAQLSNNVIITGIPEQQWENYDLTKQQVIDTVAASKGTSNDPIALEEAQKVEISYCTRVGRYNPGVNRPISVTFQKREDKEQLLKNKKMLSPGLYVNEEFPMQVKRHRID